MTGRTAILTAVLPRAGGPVTDPWPLPDGIAPLWARDDEDAAEEEEAEDDDFAVQVARLDFLAAQIV